MSYSSCPQCGAPPPAGSSFCPRCGAALAAPETVELHPEPVVPHAPDAPRPATSLFPRTVHRAYVRPLGVPPLPVLGGLAALALVAAVVLLAVGAVAAGLIVAGLAIGSLSLTGAALRGHRDDPAIRRATVAAHRLTEWGRLGVVAAHANTRACLDVVRIRQRRRRLHNEFQASLAPLGEAVYRGEPSQAEALKRRAEQLEHQLHDADGEEAAAIAAAREMIARERTTVEPTQVLPKTQQP